MHVRITRWRIANGGGGGGGGQLNLIMKMVISQDLNKWLMEH